MKNCFILLFALVIISTCVHAQTSSGNMMLGGGLEFNSVSYQDKGRNEESTVTFSPGFGFFISDNLAVGSTLTLSFGSAGMPASDKVKRSSYALGPFARYYMFTSNENF